MLDQIISSLNEDEREMFKAFFMHPVFTRVVDENLERLNAVIWLIDTNDLEQHKLSYAIYCNEYQFWFSFKKLIENVEGTTDGPKIQTLY